VVSARDIYDAKDKHIELHRDTASCSMFGQTDLIDPIITKGKLGFIPIDESTQVRLNTHS